MSTERALALLERLRAAGVAATDITADSRKVVPGCIFAAWPGVRTDGRRYLADAAARGAAALLWEEGDGFVSTDFITLSRTYTYAESKGDEAARLLAEQQEREQAQKHNQAGGAGLAFKLTAVSNVIALR